MIKEFREFIMKGNMMDMAIGIILGLAFAGIINSLVKDVLMPPIGLLLGKVDFSNLFLNLSGSTYDTLAQAEAAGAPVIKYGLFLNAIINFLIVALVLFFIIRAINRVRKPEVATKDCPFCTSSISLAASRCPNCTSEITPA